MCGFMVSREMSDSTLNCVVKVLTSFGGMINGGVTGEIPLVPKINSEVGRKGAVGLK